MHLYRHRVLYGDTDQMGVVYYGNYLRFFEGARNEWCRDHGVTYRDIEAAGVMLPVIDAQVRYRRPAKYDDTIVISTRVLASRVTLQFHYEVRRDGEADLLASGHTTHACVSREGRPTRFPAWLEERLRPHVGKIDKRSSAED